MEDFFDLDKIKAKVHLLQDGDSKNVVMTTDEKLMVVRKGVRHVYGLNELNSLSTGNKKLLLPLIIGAIMAPFAFSSSFANVFHPIVHLIFTLLGLLLFFIGWVGKSTLSINFRNGVEEFYFLPYISKNLQAFIVYINSQLGFGKEGIGHLIFVENEYDNEEWLTSKNQRESHFPIYGYTYQQYIEKRDMLQNVVAIDPGEAGLEIRFEYDEKQKLMRPKINSPIDKKSIIEVEV